jgi:hypothetical protein
MVLPTGSFGVEGRLNFVKFQAKKSHGHILLAAKQQSHIDTCLMKVGNKKPINVQPSAY